MSQHSRPPRRSQLRWRPFLAAMLVGPLVVAGCGGSGQGDWEDTDPAVVATIIEPADGDAEVVTSTGITFSTDYAAEVIVELHDVNGDSVDGELTADGTVWQPAGQLQYETTYVATVTATAADGDSAIATSTFTTMSQPEQQIRVFSFIGNDEVVGVAMPLRIEFLAPDGTGYPIPTELRPEIERRMTVRSDPPQEGSWHWTSDHQVHYRPREFWEPGTQINYRVTTGGLPVEDGWYLGNDLNLIASVGKSVLLTIDNDTKQMTVTVDGKVERTIPVSLGDREWPSSSGTFVIMEKLTETVFDTYDQLGKDDGYRVDIEYAMRLTYSGEFIHSAPWSVDDQGVRNVSHGCVNVAPDNAKYLFKLTHRWGDPVIITGTERQYTPGNGWTDWNLDWEKYQEGSALFEGNN